MVEVKKGTKVQKAFFFVFVSFYLQINFETSQNKDSAVCSFIAHNMLMTSMNRTNDNTDHLMIVLTREPILCLCNFLTEAREEALCFLWCEAIKQNQKIDRFDTIWLHK